MAAERDGDGGDGRTVGGLRLRRLTGAALERRIDDLARLRIAVFRAFPYLYAGDADYERRYLATYVAARDSALIAAFDGDRVVGAATGLPLTEETDEVIQPFRDAGFDVAGVFYFGESVLLPDYRGRGVGVAFFDEREAWARSLGRFHTTCFCGVERPADHPRRPADHVPLDAFWRRRGYQPVPDLAATFSWRDLDEDAESPKRMLFWSKSLRP